MRIGILGTRGVPARYGGFETLAEELSARLAERGHEVTVYGRTRYMEPGLTSWRGARIRTLPTIPTKHLDTVLHGLVSGIDAAFIDSRGVSDHPGVIQGRARLAKACRRIPITSRVRPISPWISGVV